MAWATAAEVKSAINFPTTGAPVSDADIATFITDAQVEVEQIYGTKFGNVETSGTASSGAASSLTKTGAGWTVDAYADMVVYIVSGTGSGQYRSISSNTAEVLTVTPNWTTNPANDSVFRIMTLGYRADSVDGTGNDTMFVEHQPLINLVALTINSTTITPAYVYKTLAAGKLELSSSAEASSFTDTTPQLIAIKYVYGVYPFPRPIKRLCICIAAIKTLMAQIAGTYDDFTTVSLPAGFNASKGEPYMNIKSSLDYLQREARGIVYGSEGDQLAVDFKKVPVYRPFMMFG